MDFPPEALRSGLFQQLESDRELLSALAGLRAMAGRLAETISRTVPSFTDHSLVHMDALWQVSDRVLTSDECKRLSTGEAFLLAAGFYLHDIGMAYAATAEGLASVRASSHYQSVKSSIETLGQSNDNSEARAISSAVRSIHAQAAVELSTGPIPGTQQHLFEHRSFREAWGRTCGLIAASHHWNLDRVDDELGMQGAEAPLPGGRGADLAYVACLLRTIDYAHINRDRSPSVIRDLRPTLEPDSLVHWVAQQDIDGPKRVGDDLVYRSSQPISDVDAWWLYYSMLTGLDAEIRAVKRYLDRRPASQGRYSLQGVRGASSPEEAAANYIRTSGFLPIEVNLRTGSIERLVELLAGETLYGPDPMAAVRELIQNASDALRLKGAVSVSDHERVSLTLPIKLRLRTSPDPTLEIVDYGIGMTSRVMTNYLISIASDYWSSQFYTDFPRAKEQGFSPAGKFGIGFLSVFMLGDSVSVESNRVGNDRFRLSLRGVGRRGELIKQPPTGGSGTRVYICLRPQVVSLIKTLPDLVRIYAPMLQQVLEVDVDGVVTEIVPKWYESLTPDALREWVFSAVEKLQAGKSAEGNELHQIRNLIFHQRKGEIQTPWALSTPEYKTKDARLVACFDGTSVICLRGLAIQPIHTPGFSGLIQVDSVVPDVSRRHVISGSASEILSAARTEVRPQIIKNLDELGKNGLIIDSLKFLALCGHTYGEEVLRQTSARWINLLKMPGELELVDHTAFLERLAKASSLFIAFGTGPWTAMRKWATLERPPAGSELAVVLDDAGQPSPPYLTYNETRAGSIADLWPKYAGSILFTTLIRTASQAWQVSTACLDSQPLFEHSSNTIWGRMKRP